MWLDADIEGERNVRGLAQNACIANLVYRIDGPRRAGVDVAPLGQGTTLLGQIRYMFTHHPERKRKRHRAQQLPIIF